MAVGTEQLLTDIRSAVDTVTDPCSKALGRPVGLVQMGVVREVEIDGDGLVTVSLVLTDPLCPFWTGFERDITAAVRALDGVSGCAVELLDEIWSPDLDPHFREWTSRHTAERRAELGRRAASSDVER